MDKSQNELNTISSVSSGTFNINNPIDYNSNKIANRSPIRVIHKTRILPALITRTRRDKAIGPDSDSLKMDIKSINSSPRNEENVESNLFRVEVSVNKDPSKNFVCLNYPYTKKLPCEPYIPYDNISFGTQSYSINEENIIKEENQEAKINNLCSIAYSKKKSSGNIKLKSKKLGTFDNKIKRQLELTEFSLDSIKMDKTILEKRKNIIEMLTKKRSEKISLPMPNLKKKYEKNFTTRNYTSRRIKFDQNTTRLISVKTIVDSQQTDYKNKPEKITVDSTKKHKRYKTVVNPIRNFNTGRPHFPMRNELLNPLKFDPTKYKGLKVRKLIGIINQPYAYLIKKNLEPIQSKEKINVNKTIDIENSSKNEKNTLDNNESNNSLIEKLRKAIKGNVYEKNNDSCEKEEYLKIGNKVDLEILCEHYKCSKEQIVNILKEYSDLYFTNSEKTHEMQFNTKHISRILLKSKIPLNSIQNLWDFIDQKPAYLKSKIYSALHISNIPDAQINFDKYCKFRLLFIDKLCSFEQKLILLMKIFSININQTEIKRKKFLKLLRQIYANNKGKVTESNLIQIAQIYINLNKICKNLEEPILISDLEKFFNEYPKYVNTLYDLITIH